MTKRIDFLKLKTHYPLWIGHTKQGFGSYDGYTLIEDIETFYYNHREKQSVIDSIMNELYGYVDFQQAAIDLAEHFPMSFKLGKAKTLDGKIVYMIKTVPESEKQSLARNRKTIFQKKDEIAQHEKQTHIASINQTERLSQKQKTSFISGFFALICLYFFISFIFSLDKDTIKFYTLYSVIVNYFC